MSQLLKGTLAINELVDRKYAVKFFIKSGSAAETYRVKDKHGKTCFLKLLNCAKLHRTQFDQEGNIQEIELLKQVKHPNLVKFRDSGEVIIGLQKFAYLVLGFISGETLADKLAREQTISVYDTRLFISGVLNGLKYLHNQPEPVIHNDITIQNVMLDLSGKLPVPQIIDFGYAKNFHQTTKSFNKEGLNPFYMAGECFNKVYSPQSDLFSVGAMLYHLLFGMPPWFIELPRYQADKGYMEELILEERKRPLKFPDLDTDFELSEHLLNTIKKALNQDVDSRFKTADEFISALNEQHEIEEINNHQPTSEVQTKKTSAAKTVQKTGKGFEGIAGMDSLKEVLYNDVIRALNERELYEQYGLTLPNGMLLYGPPGCGKTFFAEKLAEEVEFNFISVKPSDLASIYVHGQQEKIGQLFKEARKNAPSILFIDELDALMPSREGDLSHSYAESVNEFLAQMTNCAKDGVFVIGATNRPEKIDKAILRTGRMDKIIYLSPPDLKARVAMFQLHLKSRPLDFGLDYDELARLTENYVSSDIEFLVNEAARNALIKRGKISQQVLREVIQKTKPSVSESEILKYGQLRKRLEGTEGDSQQRPGIGFRNTGN